ncbi:MAG: questin oxidase family protein [Casimicrobium sp.]
MQLATMENSVLHEIQDRCAAYAPEYGNGLSDHLPMLLHAMHSLGASDERLEAYAAMYRLRLEKPNVAHFEMKDWRAPRGRLDAYDALARTFSLRIASESRDTVLREVLPTLLPGVAAGAFHGLIRCGHAISADHDDELARGLAYWAAAYLPLLADDDATQLPAPSLDLSAWLGAAYDLNTAADTERPRITLRMKAWAQSPQFGNLAPALQTDNETMKTFTRLTATLYAQTGNFTVLHMVTSSHAMLVLRPWLDDFVGATRWYGIALFAALRAARLTRDQVATAQHTMSTSSIANDLPRLPWNELAAAAIASDDDHAAKIVYSSRALFEIFGDEVFHAAATRGVLTQARA